MTSKILIEVVSDLRDYSSLVDKLPERQAIYQAHPSDEPDYKVAVIITPIFDGSTPQRGVISKETRIQVTVKSTRQWREEKDTSGLTGIGEMQDILRLVGDRLELAYPISGSTVPLGGESGTTPQPSESGRLSITADWRIRQYE